MVVALVGQPNSGKSALIAKLTGARVVTSNYPGTTVELLQGRLRGDRGDVTVLDTPGIYSLAASSKEQEVTRAVLEGRHPAYSAPDLIVNVVDATNLARHLSLTLSLLGYGIPVVIALNSADRLPSLGLEIDVQALSARLGVPAILTSALTGEGIPELIEAISRGVAPLAHTPQHTPAHMPAHIPAHVLAQTPANTRFQDPSPRKDSARHFYHEATRIAKEVVRSGDGPGDRGITRRARRRRRRWAADLDNRLDQPVVSLFVLGVGLVACWKVVAWAIPYAEVAVKMLLTPISEILTGFLASTLPPGPLSQTIAHAVPEGIVLPLSTVLPAMLVAYTLIALLEDSGLLGRYAALGDTLMRLLGLPGQALIPLVLAFGCRVPALMSARILPSGESRRAASVVVATVVPCAATVSLAATALARFGGYPLVPLAAVMISIVVLGRVLNLASGQARDPLVLELPPLRFPMLRNVLMKTHMRTSGFFTHVLPLVMGMNIVIRLLGAGSGLAGGSAATSFVQSLLGIPPEALLAVVLTMVQRYLAPLFLMSLPLDARQATIAVTMVALGLPCLPSAVTLGREMGLSAVVSAFAVSILMSVGWGIALNLLLP